jgi:hypothetical protein
MKKSLLLLLSICSLCLLDGCGGGSSTPPPVATHFSLTAPATASAGSSFNLTVIALDAANNEVSSYLGTVTFSSTDGRALLPANSTLAGGTGTISVTLESQVARTHNCWTVGAHSLNMCSVV